MLLWTRARLCVCASVYSCVCIEFDNRLAYYSAYSTAPNLCTESMWKTRKLPLFKHSYEWFNHYVLLINVWWFRLCLWLEHNNTLLDLSLMFYGNNFWLAWNENDVSAMDDFSTTISLRILQQEYVILYSCSTQSIRSTKLCAT